MKTIAHNQSLFTSAHRESSARHSNLADSFGRTSPLLSSTWEELFPNTQFQLGSTGDFRRWLSALLATVDEAGEEARALRAQARTAAAIAGRFDFQALVRSL